MKRKLLNCDFLKKFENWDGIKVLLFTRCNFSKYKEHFEISRAKVLRYYLFLKSLKRFPKAIIYKGLWYNFSIYRLGERFISDVDLIVDEEGYEEAVNNLKSMGFDEIKLIPDSMPPFLKRSLEWEAPLKRDNLLIEIHKKPFPPYYIDIPSEKFFKRANLWFKNFYTLPAEDNFILSVLHFHKSTKRSPLWIVDIVILSENIDSEKLEYVLNYYGIEKEVFMEILEGIYNINYPWESAFFKHGFVFKNRRVRRLLKFLLLKVWKRLTG